MANSPNWHLGQTSESYESGGNGPGTISSGNGDYGGASYGQYQFSIKTGTLNEYLNQSAYGDKFRGLQPATPAFDAEWKKLASNDSVRFGQDQHDFIKKTHYDVQMQALKNDGLDLSSRGPAVQDALWSTAVQFGGHTPEIFEKGLEEKFSRNYVLSNLTDKDIVEAVQDYKIKNNESLFKHSPRLQQSLLDRATNEKMDLQALAEGRAPDPSQHLRTTHGHPQKKTENETSHGQEATLKQGSHGDGVQRAQDELQTTGYLHDAPDGYFGPATKAALEDFQRVQGLEADGKIGTATQKRLDAVVRDRQISDHTSGLPSLREFSDPCHPQSALYNTLKDGFPPGASTELLSRATAACYMSGIKQPNDLGNVICTNGSILFDTSSLLAKPAVLDISQPAPSVQQTMQQVQQYDQQQAQIQAQVQQANQQANMQQQGPVMGGPQMGR